MNGIGRRALLRFAAATVALPVLATVSARAQGRFAPPPATMRYTRRLERELTGGARFIVDRSFAVRFVPESGGFRVEGEQLDAAVEAPAQLEAFARLERERVETGVFPLELDGAGAILRLSHATDSEALDQAVREAGAEIDRWQLTPAERDRMRAFVEAVHRSAGALVTEPPRDLFAPVDCPREESRAVALPGGETGQVRIRFTATRDPATGLMRVARREVVTEVAGDLRRTIESWTLALLV
jgi:hypothetical protein